MDRFYQDEFPGVTYFKGLVNIYTKKQGFCLF